MSCIYRLAHAADDLQSRWTSKEVRARKRWRMKRDPAEDLEPRPRPKFDTQSTLQKGKRRIGSKTARAMVTWSHTFRQRLLDKAREYPWCKVVLVDEAHTSKTCVRCGHIHRSLGGSKTFLSLSSVPCRIGSR
jgi:transposase